MKSILIGISAPNNNQSREAMAVITEEFGLEHLSMRQPLINIMATLTNEHPTHYQFCNAQQQIVQGLGVTVAETEAAISLTLRSINPAFFIERMKVSQAISRRGMNSELFCGDLISDIKTEQEAQWIRSKGGLIVHLYNYNNLSEFHALNEMDNDLVVTISNEHPTKNNMAATLAAIKTRINKHQKAA